jgi:hypothetical protein
MIAHSVRRTMRLAVALALVAAAPLHAQNSGTDTRAATISREYWYWGNWYTINDCGVGTQPCGAGNQASATGYSSATATTQLGYNTGIVTARGNYAFPPNAPTPNAWNSEAYVESYWFDTFTINSTVLAAGTPVDINLSILFNSNHGSGLDPWQTSAYMSYGGPSNGLFGVQHDQGQGGPTLAGLYTYTLRQLVGQTFRLYGGLKLSTSGDSYVPRAPATGVDNETDAQARYFVDPGSGASGWTLTAGSGYDYSTPGTTVAPEPASFALVFTGLGACAFVRRRRRQG